MIALKTILFILSLLMSLAFLEDVIEKIILHSKKDELKFTVEYTTGLTGTFSGTMMFFVALFWGIFYLLYQF